MKEYDVKITETLEKTVTVRAENLSAAQEKVRQAYSKSEYEFEPVKLINMGISGKFRARNRIRQLFKNGCATGETQYVSPGCENWL